MTMNRVCYRASLLVGIIIAGSVLAGCAQPKTQLDRFSKPIFMTKPPRKARVQPRPVPPPVQHYAYVPRPAPLPVPPPPAKPKAVLSEAGWTPPQGIQNRWSEIVIHHSASATGGAVSFDQYHRNVRKWDELGYHFVIGNGSETFDGKIEVGSRWTKQKTGAHCKTGNNHYNKHGVGICLVGNFENSSPSSAQIASLDKLLLFLSQQCGISADHVLSHGAVTNRTACPGRRFPLSTVKRNLTLARSRLQSGMLASSGITP
ncbi:MAG: N-acetylmuramoyl-L-alanine amidase [Planctomycetes bacterium]|nr:N-acetylmuramoyl-L-alanine amidase [Planctomycetota bacterium]